MKKEENDQITYTLEEALEILNPDVKAKIKEKRVAYLKVCDTYSNRISKKRYECHQWFDKLWHGHEQRVALYQRLANELGIELEQCHFSTLTSKQLDKALSLLKKWWWEKYDI